MRSKHALAMLRRRFFVYIRYPERHALLRLDCTLDNPAGAGKVISDFSSTADEPVAKIVQCGEPSLAPRAAGPRVRPLVCLVSRQGDTGVPPPHFCLAAPARGRRDPASEPEVTQLPPGGDS